MSKLSQGKIFVADERGLIHAGLASNYATFSFGQYNNPHKSAFGNIRALNDYMLPGRAAQMIKCIPGFYIFLLPVSGAFNYSDSFVKNELVAAGQVQVITVNQETDIEIKNPFKNDPINFLQIHIKSGNYSFDKTIYRSTFADINRHMNKMVPVFPSEAGNQSRDFRMQIGKFGGRGELNYIPGQTNSAFFGFVLEGAFEIAGRLLHARDGLALWNVNEIEIEALSNDAILLTIEIGYSGQFSFLS